MAPRAPQDRQPKAKAPASFVDITTADAPEQTRETLFAIDGTRYDVDVPVPANMALKAMDKMVEMGENAAMMWLLRELIGREGYDALKNCDAVTSEQLGAILERLQVLALGDLESLGKG